MEIGQVIKLLIKKRGLKQIDVAERIGKSTTALSQIINGNYKPQPETLEKLCEVLEVPVAVVHFLSITEDDVPKENIDLFRNLAPSMEKYLLDVFTAKKEDLNLV
ncbi:DNA-binding protein [Flavobacterium indicum GPTSA100-9 = DSM 17447]|uniref:DNA-binding protein n=1 Tax=Flavobacterium indicum (strain DSM 17447 / CIP 109464 / GPTSA100-9) TaxID=1094466 RepID=H8XNQ4_FLAIG|nr:helix-turn-helix transcriptional regulator [Flavobacterium indicum]CCG52171.1 DNA-binding protein [Flavobacterium indicum GPTSA100-9 = DSM 17447]